MLNEEPKTTCMYEKRKDYLIDKELSKTKYYHIFDFDAKDYLHTGRNSTSKRDCLEDYMYYRRNDLVAWTSAFDSFDDYVMNMSDQDILDDMCACNFELSETTEKFEEEEENKIFLGDYVETGKYGYRGRVTQIESCYNGTGKRDAWSEGQQIKVTDEELDKEWIHILVDGAGAVVCSSLEVKRIEPFDFQNPYKDVYFNPKEKEQ